MYFVRRIYGFSMAPSVAWPQVVVRRYMTERGVFVGVINTGLGLEEKTVSLDAGAFGGARLLSLVTAERVNARTAAIALRLPPVCLRSWRVE